MLKNLFTLLLLAVFVASPVFAQNKVVKDKVKQLPTLPDGSGITIPTEGTIPAVYPVNNPAVGDTIGGTTYDYFSNSVVRDQIVYWDGKPHMAPMQRWTGTSRRKVDYIRPVSGVYTVTNVFDTTTGNAGWPQIDVARTGSAPGTIGVVGHHIAGGVINTKFAVFDGTSAFLVSPFGESGTDPSVQWIGDVAYLATSGNRVQYRFFKTTDFGVSFTGTARDSIGGWVPPLWWVENGGVEVGMCKSANEQHLAYFGTASGIAGGGNHNYNGTAIDSCDNFWIIKSSDAGANWSAARVAADGVIGSVAAYPTYAPLYENFGQVDAAVSNDGVYHYVANGYGLDFTGTTATGNVFPVLYWNSNNTAVKSISDRAIDTIQAISDLYPTNSIGQAYPSVSVTADGQVVYVVWTGPQMTNGQLDTAGGYYWRDLYHAFSTDGGATWNYGGVLAGKKDKSEVFGHAAQLLEREGNVVTAHILYLEDSNTDVGPFSGVYSYDPLIYKTFTITLTDVEDNAKPVSFTLDQNYPNPFNPSTTIKFNLSGRSNVSLRVFDMLGREVATLVNGVREAGNHEVNFNASNLTSGLYIYKLEAGSQTATRKMMLVK